MPPRFIRTALILSLALNVLLIAGIWYYQSIEGVLGIVELAVGLFN